MIDYADIEAVDMLPQWVRFKPSSVRCIIHVRDTEHDYREVCRYLETSKRLHPQYAVRYWGEVIVALS